MDDSVFTDTPMVATNRDILSMTQWDISIPDGEMGAIKHRALQTTDIKTSAQLRRRVMEYVHVYSILLQPQRLNSINRRFSRVAQKVGTSSREAIQMLIQSGHIVELVVSGTVGIYSASIYKEKVAVEIACFGNDPRYIDELKERLMFRLDGQAAPPTEELPPTMESILKPTVFEPPKRLIVPKRAQVLDTDQALDSVPAPDPIG